MKRSLIGIQAVSGCHRAGNRVEELVSILKQMRVERHDKVPRMHFLLQRQAHQLTGKFVVLESERVRLRPLRN
jgi:hypothetical protein